MAVSLPRFRRRRRVARWFVFGLARLFSGASRLLCADILPRPSLLAIVAALRLARIASPGGQRHNSQPLTATHASARQCCSAFGVPELGGAWVVLVCHYASSLLREVTDPGGSTAYYDAARSRVEIPRAFTPSPTDHAGRPVQRLDCQGHPGRRRRAVLPTSRRV